MAKRLKNEPPIVIRGCIAVNCGEGVRINGDIVIDDCALINTPAAITVANGAKVKVTNTLHKPPKGK